MIRYMAQIMMMLGDVIFLFMMGLGMYSACEKPINPVMSIIIVVAIFVALKQWDKMGGFNAWKPSKVKVFLENAKKQGM